MSLRIITDKVCPEMILWEQKLMTFMGEKSRLNKHLLLVFFSIWLKMQG